MQLKLFISLFATLIVLQSRADEELARIELLRCCNVEDNVGIVRDHFQTALSECANDTNRFVAILKDMIPSADIRPARMLLSSLRRYGSASDLDYVTALSTNVNLGGTAAITGLYLGGISSNTLMSADSYLALTNSMSHERFMLCAGMLEISREPWVDNAASNALFVSVLNHARKENECVKALDYCLMKYDSTYRYSARRLSVLRSLATQAVAGYSVDYITNAINMLVAYPEADLNE